MEATLVLEGPDASLNAVQAGPARDCLNVACHNTATCVILSPAVIGVGRFCCCQCKSQYDAAHPEASATERELTRVLLREVGPFQTPEQVSAILTDHGMLDSHSVIIIGINRWTRVYLYDNGDSVWTLDWVAQPPDNSILPAVDEVVPDIEDDPFGKALLGIY